MRRGLYHAAVPAKTVKFGRCCLWSLRLKTSAGKRERRCGLKAVEVTPAPPRPAFYVPPDERDPNDPSLSFLRREAQPSEVISKRGSDDGEVRPGVGQSFSPELPSRSPHVPRYMDDKAASLASTSVFAGQHLLSQDCTSTTRRLTLLKNSTRAPEETDGRDDAAPPQMGHKMSIFDSMDRIEGGEEGEVLLGKKERSVNDIGEATQLKRPLLHQIEIDMRRLEYYQGSTRYPELLNEFRAKYGYNSSETSKNKNDRCNTPSDSEMVGERSYTKEELERGLEAQPIDYLRASNRLKIDLTGGPRAYDPVVAMQKLGVMRFKGYAFPPTTELGKLRDGNGRELLPREEKGALKEHILGKNSAIKTQVDGGEDNHILRRVLGLDAVQRWQVRVMLSDFDYGDRHTAFHVMMSYPYTDWLHVFYMVLVGVALYELQVRFEAYDFYDEYLGLDLRQVPRLKKPFLTVVTVVVMMVVLFQPLLVASIATTRFYRIAMRRPIGPP